MALANKTLAIFLISSECRAMLGIFEADEPASNKLAKRELFKTFDKNIKPGDLVMTETNTRHKVSVIKIVEADVEVNFHAQEACRWIIAKVDMAEHDRILSQENEFLTKLRAAELRKERDDMKKALFAEYSAELENLPLIQQGAETLPAPETQPAE